MTPIDRSAEKFERQMNLLAAMSESARGIRAIDIQEKVPGYNPDHESFRRTFERDKKDLLALGVPIEVVPGPTSEHTAYRVDRSRYELPDPGLDADELAALHLALETVTVGSSSDDMARAMWRLGGVVDAATSDPLGVPTGELTEIPSEPSLMPLFRAVLEQRVATFEYESSTSISTRKVEPWKLDFRRGRWNLTAFDLERDEQRNFRLDRIRGDVTLGSAGGHVHPQPSTPMEPADPWEFGDGEPVMTTVRFDAEVADFALAALGSCESVPGPDGSIEVSVPVSNWDAFRSFILSFIERAEVLGPPESRLAMTEWLRDVAGVDRG